MCGRLNVMDSPLVQALCLAVGIDIGIPPPSNADVRPTQRVLTLGNVDGQLARIDATWGIKPAWAKKLLINAQAETVDQKPTFRDAFQHRRCLVPCTGYYEWRDEGGKRKQKYHFHSADGQGLLMAGIFYPGDTPQLVTLTTRPNTKMAEYHHRMPVFVLPSEAKQYIQGTNEEALALCTAIDADYLAVEKAA